MSIHIHIEDMWLGLTCPPHSIIYLPGPRNNILGFLPVFFYNRLYLFVRNICNNRNVHSKALYTMEGVVQKISSLSSPSWLYRIIYITTNCQLVGNSL